MNDVARFLSAVSDSFKAMAKAVDAMAAQLGQLPHAKSPQSKSPVSLTAPRQKKTSSEIVFEHIQKSGAEGINASDIAKHTGFNKKKIHNCIFRLKKLNLIETRKRGLYTAK